VHGANLHLLTITTRVGSVFGGRWHRSSSIRFVALPACTHSHTRGVIDSHWARRMHIARTHTHAITHALSRARILAHGRMHARAHKLLHAHLHACTHARRCTHTHAHTHTHTHTHTHVRTHARTHWLTHRAPLPATEQKLEDAPAGTPTYLRVAMGPPRLPPRKLCAVTGFEAKCANATLRCSPFYTMYCLLFVSTRSATVARCKRPRSACECVSVRLFLCSKFADVWCCCGIPLRRYTCSYDGAPVADLKALTSYLETR
jgi:hypothetical protein